MLRLRLIFGLSLAAVVIGLLAADGYLSTSVPPRWIVPGLGTDAGSWLYRGGLTAAVLFVFVWLAAHELVQFARSLGHEPPGLLTQLGAVGLAVGPWVSFNSLGPAAHTSEVWGMFLLAIMLGLAFWLQSLRHGTHHVMGNIATAMFIMLYTGGLGHFLCRLRMEVGGSQGSALLLLSLFVVKMTDVGAYFTGRLLGHHKLIEWLSPKKTWEGLIGGIVVAALCALAVGHILRAADIVPPYPTTLPYSVLLLIFGLLMALLSAAGDLCASLLKRDAAVKDSGQALPGLGGVLDVLDSPLLAAPVAWWFWTRLLALGAAA